MESLWGVWGSGVIGVAELLLDTPLAGEQRSMVEMICSSGDSLLRIISDVLDLSKIEGEMLVIEFCDFDLRKHLQEAVALEDVVIRDKGLKAGPPTPTPAGWRLEAGGWRQDTL